jgi:hypothetical protein
MVRAWTPFAADGKPGGRSDVDRGPGKQVRRTMFRSRGAAAVGVLGLALALTAPSAGATTPEKRLKPCTVVAPIELEPIFEQPFRNGIADDGGGCNFRKPEAVRKDDIVVSVIPERFDTVKQAKRAYTKKLSIATELLLAAPETVQAGNEAFYALFIGTDLLTMRTGRIVVEVRVENNDDDAAVYHDQVIAVGQTIAARLAAAP